MKKVLMVCLGNICRSPLAQGILESGSGKGRLAKEANNHFGIKCHDWNGERIYHDDDRAQECFRKYDHPNQSYRDHSLFLVKRKRYSNLFKFKTTDYKSWAKELKKAVNLFASFF